MYVDDGERRSAMDQVTVNTSIALAEAEGCPQPETMGVQSTHV